MPSLSPLSTPQAASPLQYDILFSESDDNLPAPLPSIEAIEDAPIINKLISRCIVCVGTSYVAKYGYGVERLEAENMKFVQRSISIHVPRVYAVYQRTLKEGEQKTYIIMEKIPGKSLDKLWDGFDTAQKLGIVQQLKESFISLRNLPHQGFFGSLDKTKLRDFLFTADEPMPSIDTPFYAEEALISGLVERFMAEDPDRLRHKAAYYRRVLLKVFKGNGRPVFTHADLQPKNIMLQPDGCIAILDWAASGWYPTYWEYAVAVCAHRGWSNDWHTHIGLLLEEYPNHFAWMSRQQMDRWY